MILLESGTRYATRSSGSVGNAAAIRWRTLAEIVEPQWQPIVVSLTLLFYATIAMAFSTAVMLYGIFGEVVARRRREFAIRLSIGASPWGVVMLLVRTTSFLS
jgi:ABC-type antimicrobial peptide transport system permease subunit